MTREGGHNLSQRVDVRSRTPGVGHLDSIVSAVYASTRDGARGSQCMCRVHACPGVCVCVYENQMFSRMKVIQVM